MTEVNPGGLVRIGPELPRHPGRPHVQPPWLEALKAESEKHPGEWFLVEHDSDSKRVQMRRARLLRGKWGIEVATRTMRGADGFAVMYGIYARLPVADKVVVKITPKSATTS